PTQATIQARGRSIRRSRYLPANCLMSRSNRRSNIVHTNEICAWPRLGLLLTVYSVCGNVEAAQNSRPLDHAERPAYAGSSAETLPVESMENGGYLLGCSGRLSPPRWPAGI